MKKSIFEGFTTFDMLLGVPKKGHFGNVPRLDGIGGVYG